MIKIPIAIEAPQTLTTHRRTLKAVESMRAKAQGTGVTELSLDEINEEIRLSREERNNA